MVACSSVLESIASIPFTHQWTMRVSKAPKIRISEEAPSVKAIYKGTTEVLDNLEQGINTRGGVIIDPKEPWSASRVPFYVIISLEGVSTGHAVLRVFSKAASVGVFAAGTAMFASATLVTISMALTTLCLVLGAGVFGRVVTLWLASEMVKTNPILHRVVKSRTEAAAHIEQIMEIDDLLIEVMGHIVIEGKCVHRYNKYWNWSVLIGILASPFDILKLAV